MTSLARRITSNRDLLLLLCLLLLILVHPLLDHDTGKRLLLAGLTFAMLILATVVVSAQNGSTWLAVLLLVGALGFGVANALTSYRAFAALQWATTTALFGVIITHLFSYLRAAREISHTHLYTASTIYLLLGMLWFALYNCIEVLYPGSFMQGNETLNDPRSELLYFSLVTLTTVGYGDIVPVGGVVRMLAALEAGAGVLYVAITVAVLVSAHKRSDA